MWREGEEEREGKRRRINLYCPALSMASQLVACDDDRIDLGSIARAFGIQPSTLKLNDHFISRGPDLIASSITWKSLFSFFSSKQLSTHPLLVHGRLCNSGTKRTHEPLDVETGTSCSNVPRSTNGIEKQLQLEEHNLIINKRFRDSGFGDAVDKVTEHDNFSLKRKQCSESFSLQKRIKMEEIESKLSLQTTTSNTQVSCSILGKNMKRMREEEIAASAACKKRI